MVRWTKWGWRIAWIAVAGALACGDDTSGTPDAEPETGEVAETTCPLGCPDGEDGADDAVAPDEPIGPPDYPPGPYGVVIGDRIENHHFLDTEAHTLELAHIYGDTSVKLLWIYAAAGWCAVCRIESAALPGIWDRYHPEGLQILGVLFEDGAAVPAGAAYAGSYGRRYGWAFPTVSDELFVLGRYFDKAATPMNMLVDLTDMTIVEIEMGWDEGALTRHVSNYLALIADRH